MWRTVCGACCVWEAYVCEMQCVGMLCGGCYVSDSVFEGWCVSGILYGEMLCERNMGGAL